MCLRWLCAGPPCIAGLDPNGLERIAQANRAKYTPLANAIIEANPDRVVWGSDWPHPRHEGAMPNDGEMCNRLLDWVPDAATRNKVLAANPAKLYQF